MTTDTRTYLLAFDATAIAVTYSVFNYVRDAKHIETWWNHLPGVFIFNTQRELHEIQRDFLPFFNGSKFLIIEVVPYAAAGWLPQQAWDWLNNGGSNQLAILPPPIKWP